MNLRGEFKAGHVRMGKIPENVVLNIFEEKEARGWKGCQFNDRQLKALWSFL